MVGVGRWEHNVKMSSGKLQVVCKTSYQDCALCTLLCFFSSSALKMEPAYILVHFPAALPRCFVVFVFLLRIG